MSKQSKRRESLRRLWALAWPDVSRISCGLIALAVNAATNLSFPVLLGQAVDLAGKVSDAEYAQFLLRTGAIFVTGAIASYVRVLSFGTATDRIAFRLKQLLFKSYLQKSISFFDTSRSAEMTIVLDKDVASASELFTERMASAVRSVNSSFIGSILLFRASPELTGVVLAAVPIIGIGAVLLNRWSKKLAERLRDLESEMLGFSMERFGAMLTIRVNGAEEAELGRFLGVGKRLQSTSESRHAAQGSLMSFLNAAANTSLLLVLAAGGRLIASSKLTTGTLSRFAVQSVFVGLGFGALSTAYSDAVHSIDAATRVFEQIDGGLALPASNGERRLPHPPTLSTPGLAIEFERVSFLFPSRPSLVLRDVSFTTGPCGLTCICGPSGSGKSTILILATGLLRATGGNVKVNGVDVNSLDGKWLRNQVHPWHGTYCVRR